VNLKRAIFPSRKLRLGLALAVILLIVAFPLFQPDLYYVHLFSLLFMYIGLTASWNIIGGYAGYLNLGHVTFFGIGAYTSAYLMTEAGINPFLTAPLGGFLACLVAVVIGYPSLRLRGPYFAVVTLSIALLAQVVFANITQVGGGDGIIVPSMPVEIQQSESIFYWTFLGIAIGIVYFTYRLERSQFGLALLAIRNDEEAASVFGVNVVKTKLTAFVLSTYFPGVLGGIYVYQISYIEPGSAFDIGLSIDMVLMTMVGGAGTWLGPILGSTLIYLLSQVLAFVIPSELNRVVFGVILIAVVYTMPRGLVGVVRSLAYVSRPVMPQGESTSTEIQESTSGR